MSRLNINTSEKEEYVEYVPKIVKNPPEKYDNTERVLLIDADSIIYTSVYNPDRIENQTKEEIFNDIEECKFRLNKKLQEITNIIEEYFNIKQTFYFIGGENNFRSIIYPEYKKNRKPYPLYFKELKEYFINELKAFVAPFGEADDCLYNFWKLSNNNCILATIDKDIKSSCYGLFYNYRSYDNIIGEFYKVTEKESKFNLCCQILTGDVSDNVIVNKGLGIKGVLKIINPEMSDFTLKRKIFETYIKYNGFEAKKLLKTIYKIIKLHTFEEIKKISLVIQK